jgi:CRAL/TRIO domain/CRAL/TRIO, N-terminal domain
VKLDSSILASCSDGTSWHLPADSHTLLRFLRARDYDIQNSTKMYLNHLKWRKENNVDSIASFEFKERAQYLQFYPQGYYNVDKQGRPISIQHLGQVNPKRIQQVTTEERMIRFHIREYERFLKRIAPACSHKAGRHINSSTAILDVKGATILAVLVPPPTALVGKSTVQHTLWRIAQARWIWLAA